MSLPSSKAQRRPTAPSSPTNLPKSSKVLSSTTASSQRTSSQMRHYKKASSSSPTKQKPTTTSQSNTLRKKIPSPTTPTKKVDTGVSDQDFPTGYHHRVSLKDEKAVLLNDQEMAKEFERQKRR